MQTPRAVFWDMDGTIVDTEPLWMDAETRMVESFGGRWSTEDALQLVGNDLEGSAEILRRAGVELAVDVIVQSLTSEVSEALRTGGAPFRPGAIELMQSLRESGIRLGLVTMSLGRMAEAVCEQIGFDAFDVVVSGDTARRPKPFPDPYLQAAEALGVDIAETLVLEDSPTGVRSGLRSGAVTLGVPHIVDLEGLGAHELWPTLAGRTSEDITASYTRHRTVLARGRAS